MPQNQVIKRRPTFLTILCILSFISSSFWMLANLVAFLIVDRFQEFFTQKIERSLDRSDWFNLFERLLGGRFGSLEQFIDEIVTILMLNAVLYALSLAGVYMMWKLKGLGFYFYTGAQLFLLSIPFILLGSAFSSAFSIFWGAFFSLLFIALYALNLKHMDFESWT